MTPALAALSQGVNHASTFHPPTSIQPPPNKTQGGKSVSLYDVTALSAKRQKRWKWLLAMLAYRFAMRIYQQAPLFGRKRRQQLQMRCVRARASLQQM